MNAQGTSIYDYPDNDNPTEINSDGTKFWRNSDGKRHREGDKPAIIYSNGSISYYKEGKCHRDGDKPAVIHSDGTLYYYKNGKFIRKETNPFIILMNKYKNTPEGQKKDNMSVILDMMVELGVETDGIPIHTS